MRDPSETSTTLVAEDDEPYDLHKDSGLFSVIEVARSFQIPADPVQVWHMNGKARTVFSWNDILRCGKKLGLNAKLTRVDVQCFDNRLLPCVASNRTTGQFELVRDLSENGARVQCPINLESKILSLEQLRETYQLDWIIFSTRDKLTSGKSFKGFYWFLPSVIKHSGFLYKTLITSIIINIFALISPKFFESIIDTVLVSRGLSSLDVLAIGMIGIAVFDPSMNFLRSIIFSRLASRVNSEMTARVYQHLVYLPLGYFRDRQTGEITARIREMDSIRNFLTGSALTMVIDLLFVFVFLYAMYLYSFKLMLVVIAMLVILAILWLCLGPILRKRVETEYARNANNSAFLTESVTGIETIKSLGVRDLFVNEWERKLGASLNSTLRTAIVGHVAGGSIGLVSKLASAATLWFGVIEVLRQELTIGELVGFNMLSGYVTTPILRLAQIWQEFQHTGISLRRISDILATDQEAIGSAGQSSIENVEGAIEFRGVTFRYKESAPEALRRVSFSIEPGEVIGITGASGSGKSTVAKLIQRLHVPKEGEVLVDHVNLAMVDPSILRRNIGVVSQDCFLFKLSIAQNIALGDPTAELEEIRHAAQLASLDEFVSMLPDGYDTYVEERGGNLSGGQIQRIALARALVGDPRILILDEATSAVDYETEASILAHLPEISSGRTVVIIAHRLNCMPYCDRVFVMDGGQIIETGSHEELLREETTYSKLWNIQNR